MKVQLLDFNEEVVHEFDMVRDPDKNVDYDAILLWEPTQKYYGYHDQGGDWIKFIEKTVVSVSPTVGGEQS